MVNFSGLVREINFLKGKLIAKAKVTGIYENFGDTEVRYLKNKYDYLTLTYGSAKQRKYADMIDDFSHWASNYSIEDIKVNGMTFHRYF